MASASIPDSQIRALRVAFMSSDLTRALSVRETTTGNGGVNADALGVVSPHKLCPTCGSQGELCGHTAAMSSAVPLTNPDTLPNVVKLLRSVCINCSRMLVPSSLETMPVEIIRSVTSRPGKMTAKDLQALQRFLARRCEDRQHDEPEEEDQDEEDESGSSDGETSDGDGDREDGHEDSEPEPEPEEAEEEAEADDMDVESGTGSGSGSGSDSESDRDAEREKDRESRRAKARSKATQRTSQTKLDGLIRILRSVTGVERLKKIAELSERARVCGPGPGSCGFEQPCYAIDGNFIVMFPRDQKRPKPPAKPANQPRPARYLATRDRKPVTDEEIAESKLHCMNMLRYYGALAGVSADDARLLGFEPEESMPADFLFCVVPVTPNCVRPKADGDTEARGHSEVSRSLEKICKSAENVRRVASEFQESFEALVRCPTVPRSILPFLPLELFLTDLDAYWISRYGTHYSGYRAQGYTQSTPAQLKAREEAMRVTVRELEFAYVQLQENFGSMFSNSAKAKGGRPVAGTTLRKRLGTKGGLLRKHATGKRRERSGRTVISPDPEGHIAWAGLNEEMAMALPHTETVTAWNVHRLTRMVGNGPRKYPGAKFIMFRNVVGEEETADLRFLDTSQIVLQPGWKVERHVLNGDPMLFNRQPSLHRMSMVCLWVWVSNKFKVIRIPLAVTGPLAADFDGDEITNHCVNSCFCRAEAHLMLSEFHICSPRHGIAIYSFVFDSALGMPLMTQSHVLFDLRTVHLALAKLNPRLMPPGRSLEDALALVASHDPRRGLLVKALGRPVSNHEADSETLCDSLYGPVKRLPGRLLFSCILPSMLTLKVSDKVDIRDGLLLEGTLTKSVLNLLLGVINRVYGSRHAANFIYNVQTLSNEFLSVHGLSIAPEDVRVSRETHAQAQELVARAVRWADETQDPSQSLDADDLETELQNVLGETRERAGRLGLAELESRPGRNGALEIVKSGCKGNNTTVIETAVVIGPQFRETDRLNTRLPIYADEEQQLERVRKSGFIGSCYSTGLPPGDSFNTDRSNRVGQTDTATKACSTGYIARKCTKGMEGQCIGDDRCVRAANGDLISLSFGGDDFEGMFVVLTPLALLGQTEDEVAAEHSVPGDPELSTEVVETLLALRRVFVTLHAREQRGDTSVEALGTLSPIAGFALQGLCPQECVLSAREVWTSLLTVVEHALVPKHAVRPAAFLATVFETFSPVKLLGTTRTRLDFALTELVRLHDRALVPPRLQTGNVSGQSVGEPSTQLALSGAHTAGTKVNLGVQRVNEIICGNTTAKMATPVMEFFVDVATEHECRRVCEQVMSYTFEHFVVARRHVDLEARRTRRSRAASQLVATLQGCKSPSRFALEFTLDPERVALMATCAAELGDKVLQQVFSKSSQALLLLPDVCTVRIELPASDETLADVRRKMAATQAATQAGTQAAGGQPDSDFDLEQLLMRSLQTVVNGSGGVRSPKDLGVRDYKISRVNALDVAAAQKFGLSDPRARRLRFKVRTTGSDLDFVLHKQVPGLDWASCFTNSVREVQQTLGIGAASRWIIKQLQEVLMSTGSNVHSRYMLEVAQTMTHDGTVQPFGRFGVIKSQRSVFARAGFEVPVKVLQEAAMAGEQDQLHGITESVIVGQRPRIGTALVEARPRAVTMWDLRQLRPVSEQNRRTLERRRVHVDLEPDLSDEDRALLKSVRVCKVRVTLVREQLSGFKPCDPDWGPYQLSVLQYARSRAEADRLHNELGIPVGPGTTTPQSKRQRDEDDKVHAKRARTEREQVREGFVLRPLREALREAFVSE